MEQRGDGDGKGRGTRRENSSLFTEFGASEGLNGMGKLQAPSP